ncbi:HalOD1 output domain-containing protein [Halegenticoccus soli]|uniref:HalOD1 output domain-containing protein n=1 Tax=Halegenticoccus soli TaxID=1985678 RepID=UPI000C6D5340|nr:HalOD1 output domain-containing protein [Halegenticoccus soli]
MSSNTATAEWGVSPESASFAVVEAIAEMEGVDPIDLGPVLYDVVDADALDQLFSDPFRGSSPIDGRLELVVAGYVVTVRSDGTVTVRSPNDPNDP